MAQSYKPAVIEQLFNNLFDSATGSLRKTVVDSADLQKAKRQVKRALRLKIPVDSNPFNFMKDIVRGKNAEKFWPASVTAKGYSGEQRTGGGAIFEFVPITPGGKSSLAVDFVPSKHTPKTPALPCSIVHGARVQPAKAEKIFRRLISDGRTGRCTVCF